MDDGRAAQRAAGIADLCRALADLSAEAGSLEQEVVRRVGDLVGDATALWRKDDEGALDLVAFHHRLPDRRAEMARLSEGVTHDSQVGVLPHVWREKEPVVLDAAALEQWRPLMQPAYREYMRLYGMVSLVVVPLRVRGATVALLGASRDEEPGHSAEDVEFVAQVGAVVAAALDNDRLLRQLRQRLHEEERAYRAASHAALHDPLTGLANRRLLLDRLHAVGERGDAASAALLLVDLDRFKDVNDFYGHGVGDEVLVEVARRLDGVVRDGAHGRATLARLGGDEFAVLLEEGASAPHVADEVLREVKRPLASLPSRTSISASIGAAHGLDSDPSALLRRADIAMYRAKRERLGWAAYRPELDGAAEVRLRDIAELRTALSERQLRLHYQPVVPAQPELSGGPAVVEALVRWQHPRRDLLLPAVFLPLASQTGLMLELSAVVLDLALRDNASWRRRGLDVQVAVNVGADVLASDGFVALVLDLLTEHGVPAERLCLELTESEVLSAEGAELLTRVRAAGVAVALDDFGTGYSSLSSLADLPLDRLKFDQSFVRRLSSGAHGARLVTGLVRLVHDLECPIVAEGVETDAELRLLADLGVEWVQGYAVSRPLTPEHLVSWLDPGDPPA